MLTLRMARRARRGLSEATWTSILHALFALAFALMVVMIVTSPPKGLTDSALSAVAGP